MREGFLGALRYGREVLKSGLSSAFADTGLIELYSRVRALATGPRIHVLGYHRVVDHLDVTGESSAINPALCITTDSFRRQMRQVRERFQVVTLDEAMRAMDGELELDRDACAITFDDGYHDVLARAHGVLAELGIPATVFIPTGFSGSARPLTHDRLYTGLWHARRRGLALRDAPLPASAALDAAQELLYAAGPAAAVDLLITRVPAGPLSKIADGLEALLDSPMIFDRGAQVLTPDEIRTLAHAGWEIGAHTHGHVVLTHESPARVQEELETPKRELERWTGRPCRFFAYCNGFHSRSLVEAVRRAGYSGAVTTCDRSNARGSDRLRVGRKVLWEAHTRGPDGRWSPAISAAHLHDLFGTLGMTTPVDGEVPVAVSPNANAKAEVQSCAT